MSLALALSMMLAADAPAATDPLWPRALALHRRAIVVDTHADTTSRILDDASDWAAWAPGFDFGKRSSDGHVDLPRMQEGGLDAEFFAVYVSRDYAGRGAARRTLDLIDAVYRTVGANRERMELARTAADVRRLSGRGKVAALMGIEGGHAIENSLGTLRTFHALGIRYMTLTHTNTNDWCDSSGDEPRWHGLNELGRQVVAEMNRIGMIVDVSHVSDEAFYAVMATTTAPPIASHSSCRALCNHPRNMTDDMILALAQKGGVVQINFNSGFLDQAFLDTTKSLRDRLTAEARARFADDRPGLAAALARITFAVSDAPPPLARLVDHIDRVVKLVGADHVGLGSDFDGVPSVPRGLEDCTRLPAITLELLKRGYRDEDVLKILGGNTLRVMEAVEAEARRRAARH